MTKFTNKFSEEVYRDTYKFEGNEKTSADSDIDNSFERVANAVSKIEKNAPFWAKEFFRIFDNFKFVPGGRITSNAGTNLTGTTLINCFVSGPTGPNKDSLDEIFNELKRQGMILKSEGGYGFCADFMRPRGAYINGIGVESPGSVKMLEMWDKQSEVITEGAGVNKKEKKGKNKIRKGAQMVTMSIWNPSIEEFITAKQTSGKLTKFNMSVLISDDFMHAVKNNLAWNLEFPETSFSKYNEEWDGVLKNWKAKGYPTQIYKTYANANELWNLIMKSTYTRNEPGVLFVDTINRMNNLNYCEYINATNPCLAGETLVAVADGRGYISIKQLAEEGKDVPVYCYDKNGKLAIRYMREPRISGYNQQIYKITLDDGSVLRTTGNHKFLLTSNEYKEVKDMQIGESLSLLTKYEGNIKDSFSHSQKVSKQNYWLFRKEIQKNSKSEHRLIAEFFNNGIIPKGYVVHHKDFNSKNNSPDNLQIMSQVEHDKLHSINMLGKKNPMVRGQTEWSDEKWEDYSNKISQAIGGINNGRAYKHVTKEMIEQYALELTKQKGRKFSTKDWNEFAKIKKIPSQFSNWRNEIFGGIVGLSKWAALELGFDNYIDEDPRLLESYKKLTKQGYDCFIEQSQIIFNKKCEYCGNNFVTKKRLTAYCSSSCSSKVIMNNPVNLNKLAEHRKNRQFNIKTKQVKIFLDLKLKNNKEPMRKEWELACKENKVPFRLHSGTFNTFSELKEESLNYNHRIVSIEIDNIENVYNGTVDEFHNFFVGGFETKMPDGRIKIHNFNNKNCGEQLLVSGASCMLGSINLTQYILPDFSGFDYESLEKDIPVIVRFMDNINDITNYPLPEQREQAQLKRRIGIGYLGYASALYMLQIRYGSQEALKLTEKLCSFITNKIYQASALLAKEKGTFPLYNEEEYLKSNFIKCLSEETINLIKLYGLRNSHLTSIQPTGNSSVFANNVSSGLEPIFLGEYIRTVIVSLIPDDFELPKVDFNNKTFTCKGNQKWDWIKEGDEDLLATKFNEIVFKIDKNRGLLKEEKIQDYSIFKLNEMGIILDNQDWAVNTSNLNIEDHIKTMEVFAKYIDAAISKTVNLPNEYPFDDFKSLYERIFDTGYIKGCTTYRAGTMASVLSSTSSINNKSTEKGYIKRPKKLPCNIHQLRVIGQDWVVLVGLLENVPYEVFAFKKKDLGDNDLTIQINKDNDKISKHFWKFLETGVIEHDTGELIKHGGGLYSLKCGELVINNIKDLFESDEQESLTRIISTSLRNGVKIEYIVDQLQKSEGSIVCFSKAIARTLKKYVQDPTLFKCKACGSKKILMEEGCFKCKDCGSSKCE